MGSCRNNQTMNKIIPTISIGIPVFNEKENIENLLYSILKQSKKNYLLEKVYVVSDGSTDGTDKIVEKIAIKFPQIQLIKDGKRNGKVERVKEIFKKNSSGIILILDGDMILGNKECWFCEISQLCF